MGNILGKLGSGVHPSIDLMLKCKPLFEEQPYHLASLEGIHLVSI